jgi:arylsulfatase A-like enzyme
VIVADDLGYNDLGAFGSPSLNTPVLDRLARDGMKLNQFYSTGRCPFSSHQIDKYVTVFY